MDGIGPVDMHRAGVQVRIRLVCERQVNRGHDSDVDSDSRQPRVNHLPAHNAVCPQVSHLASLLPQSHL